MSKEPVKDERGTVTIYHRQKVSSGQANRLYNTDLNGKAYINNLINRSPGGAVSISGSMEREDKNIVKNLINRNKNVLCLARKF